MNSVDFSFILFDDEAAPQLFPLTYTKPVAELRIGIMTIREKWEHYLKKSCSYLTREYLREKYPPVTGGINMMVNGSVIPSKELINEITTLKEGHVLIGENIILACNIGAGDPAAFRPESLNGLITVNSGHPVKRISRPWDLFRKNGEELENDFKLVTMGRESMSVSGSNKTINPSRIFIEKGAKMECAIINASEGPIYIGKDAEIMEGSVIRGPLALCEHSVIKMGAKIYGPTTIGPWSKVGGEINNSIIMGYSNKAHDGFLGNSVIGEWCNMGADSNVSNLKNNYASVKLWDYQKNRFSDTGLQFCGLIMGDHSKCGINTMFNTGTVVGICANIFGSGFPRNFIPSFTWGGAAGLTTYVLPKVFEVTEIVMKRRNIIFNQTDRNILKHVFELTKKYRK